MAAKNTLLHQLSDEIASIAEKAKPAVVQIVSTTIEIERYMHPFDQFFNRRRIYEREIPKKGLGGGFIIDPSGIILTNNHVVADSEELDVYLDDGRTLKARVIGTDPDSEVAVIKVDAKNLPYLELGDSDTLRVGNIVIAIGSPQGLEQTVTFGIVSALNRSVLREDDDADFIQTDAAINPGNSGGPLLDVDGKVIGINTAIFSTSGGNQGMGFAIPINKARRIAEALQEKGKYERGYLGVTMIDLTPEAAEYLGTDAEKGAVILQVVPDGPSDGVLQVYDVIVEVNGDALKGSRDMVDVIRSFPPEKTVTMKLIRDGEKKTVKIKLGLRPGYMELARMRRGGYLRKEEKTESFDLGFTARELTREDLKRPEFSDARGLLVTKVDQSSEAFSEGLRPNMVIVEVNLREVSSLDDLRQALKSERRKRVVMLRVRTPAGNMLMFLSKK